MKRIFFGLMMVALFSIGCSGNQPIAPLHQQSANQAVLLDVPAPWVRSTATYSVMIDGATASDMFMMMWASNLFIYNDGTPSGIYKLGIGVGPCILPQPMGTHEQINPYVGGVYGVTISQSTGKATVHIFRDDGTGPVEIKTKTGSIAGTGLDCTVTVY